MAAASPGRSVLPSRRSRGVIPRRRHLGRSYPQAPGFSLQKCSKRPSGVVGGGCTSWLGVSVCVEGAVVPPPPPLVEVDGEVVVAGAVLVSVGSLLVRGTVSSGASVVLAGSLSLPPPGRGPAASRTTRTRGRPG